MSWITTSLLDTDFYKFTMQQLYFMLHPLVPGRFAFKNRSKVPLAHFVDIEEVRRQFAHARTLRFTDQEIAFLRQVNEERGGLFCEEYLEFLRGFQLPTITVELTEDGGNFVIETEGPLPFVTMWETLIMNVVNRLYMLASLQRSGKSEFSAFHEGRNRLAAKIRRLKTCPSVRFADFGTRRRWSLDWQAEVLRVLMREIPDQLTGTSNVYLAMMLGLNPIGTMAHELDMAYQGIHYELDDACGHLVSHEKMLDDWWDLYGTKLSVALSDTYGSAYFFRTFGAERARNWKGTRQDSGDPWKYADEAIAFYEGHEIDPRNKSVVFSDGLGVEKILSTHVAFHDYLADGFGWGTDLMNDLGLDPISIVAKLVWCNGHHTVKLSDNLAKATGPTEAVDRIKILAGYTGTFSEPCRV